MERVKIVSIKYKYVDLKGRRKAVGLSLRQLEKETGVSFAHINKVENGLNMTEDMWSKIEKVLEEKENNLLKEKQQEGRGAKLPLTN